ncbi:uncharacterized protein LOC123257141 [Drosophila ananassae]|uniref:uncharacterized protein LOC123257141 n=1 Tax=Drosophila ananassae TaxID=7217 RepID=UPI001CFF9A06|nr:uncharacterized protein LOC123257141 [Drosophila ananassae]
MSIKEEASTSGISNSTDLEAGTEETLGKKSESGAESVESLIGSESGARAETAESHLKRLQNLRKELGYISETDWMYDSLDKKPQQ